MEPASRISTRPLDPAAGSSPATPEREPADHASTASADPDAHLHAVLAPLGDAIRTFTERLIEVHRADPEPRETGERPCGRYGANDDVRPASREALPDEGLEEGVADEEAAPIIDEDPFAARRRGNGYDLKVRAHVSFRLAKSIDVYILRGGLPPEHRIAEALDRHLQEPWSDASLKASRQERWTDEWRERFCQWWQRLLFHPIWSKELASRRPGGWIKDSDVSWPLVNADQDLDLRRVRDLLLWAFDGARWVDPRRSFVDAVFPTRSEAASTEKDGAACEADARPFPKEPLETSLSEDARVILATIRRADPNGERALRLLWAAMTKRDQLRAAANRDSRRAQRARVALPTPSAP